MRARLTCVLALLSACSTVDAGRGDSASAGPSSTSVGTGDPTASGGTDGAPTSTSGASGTGSTGTATTGGEATTASSGGPDGSTGAVSASSGEASTGEASTGGEASTSASGGSTTGAGECVIADVPDTLGFVYSKSIDLGDIDTIQASYYNIDAQEIVFFSYFGAGRRFSLDGQALGDVTAPADALPKLDGASYDQVGGVALLITQDCRLVEADPVTLQPLKTIQLDVAEFKIGVCAGVAIGVDGNMYVISWQTEEMVTMTRDGQTELARVNLAALDLARPDGISLIAGSENFLVLSSAKQQAAILAPDGAVVVPPGPVGQMSPPLKGGMIVNSDAILTVCGNGHAWVCDEYGTKCHDFVPEDGDKDACACTIPQ